MDKVDKAKIAHLLNLLRVDINSFKKGSGKLVLISGGSCSGKTSMAKRIIKHAPQFKILSTGDFFREEAKKMGISLGELIKASDEDLLRLDKKVDSTIIKYLVETDESIVVTSRFASIWAEILGMLGKPALNIFLKVDQTGKISRMARREYCKGPFELTEGETENLNNEIERDERDIKRYETLYGVNPWSFWKYARVIDTTNMNEKEVWKKVMALVDDYIIGGLKIEGDITETENQI